MNDLKIRDMFSGAVLQDVVYGLFVCLTSYGWYVLTVCFIKSHWDGAVLSLLLLQNLLLLVILATNSYIYKHTGAYFSSGGVEVNVSEGE